MERCKSCRYYDLEKSNDNWVVCSGLMPKEVILSGTSRDCSKYIGRREWVYLLPPTSFEIRCDKCGGTNITWSEWEHLIWCYDCEIDTEGTESVFDGPVGLQACKMLGLCFDRIDLKTRQRTTPVLEGDRLVYKTPEQVIPQGIYCYDENGVCPYWTLNPFQEKQMNGMCLYLMKGDWQEDGTMLLWDRCKECDVNSDDNERVAED
jgi:hypothetical protein